MKKKTFSFPTALLILLIAVVASAVAASFFVLGTPESERFRRYDEQRVWHLQSLASTIDIYWTNEKRLPESLDELRVSRNYYVDGILDPATGTPYEYRKLNETSYELCAMFDAKSDGNVPLPVRSAPVMERSNTFWSHDAGRVCFTIGPLVVPLQGPPVESARPALD